MSDIEMKKEGEINKPIDVFRQTPEEGTPPTNPEVVKDPENGDIVTPDPTPSDVTPEPEKTPEVPQTPPAQPAKPTAPEKPEVDYKEKFSQSTRRNQVVESQFAELQKTVGDITKQEIPTDEEMVDSIPDWELLSDREKHNERKMVVMERRQNHILNTMSSIASESENMTKLEAFMSGEERLAGRTEEFYSYATNPKNKGASMEVLVNAFLFETTPAVETPTNPDTPLKDETPPSLERGNPSGGMPPEKTGNGEMSSGEMKLLRKTDPRKYNEMVRTGQI